MSRRAGRRCDWRCDSCLNGEVSVDTVRDYALARLQREPCAVKTHRDLVRLEGHETADARDLGPGVLIGPCSAVRVANVVIAGQTFIRAEGLAFDGGQQSLFDVGARHIPARREAGLVEDQRTRAIGDATLTAAHEQVAAGLANVDAVIAVGGVADDAFVLFVESVHGRPRERHPCLQLTSVGGQFGVLPRRTRSAVLASADGVPGRRPELAVAGSTRQVPARQRQCCPAGSRQRGSGQAREAGRRVCYQRCRLRRSALACAAAGARRRAVYLATDLERGTGRLFLVKAAPAARTIPLFFPFDDSGQWLLEVMSGRYGDLLDAQ